MKEFPAKTGMFLLTVCTYLSLHADPPPVYSGPMMGPMDIILPTHDPEGKEFERLAKELLLTKEQQDKTKNLIHKREKLLKEKFDKMPNLHDDLRSLLESEKVDLNSVRAKLQEISNNQLDLRMIQIQGRVEFEGQLNSEQKNKFKNINKQRFEAMKSKKGQFPERHPNGCNEPGK